MATIVLAIALLIALAGLGLEIGVVSWNIRRANKYRRKGSAAEHVKEHAISERQDMAERLTDLDKYASNISWLLNFLYNRYDKFADLEKEIEGGSNGVTGDTPIGDADEKHEDLKRALKLVKITARASERMENLMNSIASQLSQIMDDFWDGGDNEKAKESEKPAEAPEAQTLNS